jgi:hypothetical protein
VSACVCNAGFFGFGRDCQPCTPCSGNATQKQICPFNSTQDVSTCGCKSGFFGDGKTCVACIGCQSVISRTIVTCNGSTEIDTTVCECNAGYFSPTGFNCQPCPKGTFGSGATSCEACGKGAYSDQTAQVSNETCKPCPKGTYGPWQQSGELAAACVTCPAFSTTNGEGSTTRTQCVCQEGFRNAITETGGSCVGCEENQYPSSDQGSCLPCPTNTESPPGSDGIWRCTAKAGFFTRHTKTVQMTLEVPEEDADPAIIEAYVRAAAGGGDDLQINV